MEKVEMNGILIGEVETKNIMTKSSLPVGGYSVNPYVGCTHACKYCYASFMKRFTGHMEEWGTFLDVKHWPEIKNPKKFAGQRIVIGSVTDGYNPQEEQFGNTRKLLEQLRGSGADILICTKSDLVVRDIDLLKELEQVTVYTGHFTLLYLLCGLSAIPFLRVSWNEDINLVQLPEALMYSQKQSDFLQFPQGSFHSHGTASQRRRQFHNGKADK